MRKLLTIQMPNGQDNRSRADYLRRWLAKGNTLNPDQVVALLRSTAAVL